VGPDELHTVVKSLRFLAVAPGKILVVQVNEPDVVVSRVLETDVMKRVKSKTKPVWPNAPLPPSPPPTKITLPAWMAA